MATLRLRAKLLQISYEFTKRLSGLLSRVRAIEQGEFQTPEKPAGHDEVAELASACDGSRQEMLRASRLAVIGRNVSAVSHDLRHPLSNVLAYAELLANADLDLSQRRALYEQIRSSVGRMTGLIASLLEFSNGEKALQFAWGDLVEVLERAARSMQFRPEFKGIQITVTCKGNTKGWFDLARLERAFDNLLQNACEAVPQDFGVIKILVSAIGGRIEVFIVDNGPGIPEPIREKLFQPFVTYGKAAGTGLGLAAVQRIVSDHGGEVSVENTGEFGTTFKVSLPISRPLRSSMPTSSGPQTKRREVERRSAPGA